VATVYSALRELVVAARDQGVPTRRERTRSLGAFLILYSALMACGSEPASAPPAAPRPHRPGAYFSGLPRFLNPDGIRRIATEADRLNQRYELIISPHRDLIRDSRILDFGSYDGRWMYAAVDAGAKHVTGIEINPEFVEVAKANLQAMDLPPKRYSFVLGDLLEEVRKIPAGAYDGVLCAGIFYHITYHYELLKELKRIGIRWIIIDTAISKDEKPIVAYIMNPHYGLQGAPSRAALEMMLESLDYGFEYVPTTHLSGQNVQDYRTGRRITLTARHRPGSGAG
jgi:predicted RNA methylase